MKNKFLTILSVLFLSIILLTGCEKDQLEVEEERTYMQVDHMPQNILDGGWVLTLKPDGEADLLPGGDIMFCGSYNIKGSEIKVRTEQSGNYTFKILNDSEIKENEFGIIMKLTN